MCSCVRLEGIADMSHLTDGGGEILVDPNADGRVHCCAETGGFIYMRAGSGQTEDIGSELQRGI